MAGMRLHKETLPIDYCHACDEVIGYLDNFDTSTGDLVATGALVPYVDGDRAGEVIYKSANKVPYEASINFAGGPMRLEELEQGTSTTVNGQIVQGPALIIREWTLRGIAVCPYGADMNTTTEFAQKNGSDVAAVEIQLFKATGGNMSTTTKSTAATKPAELQQQQPAATPAPVTPPAAAQQLQEQPPASTSATTTPPAAAQQLEQQTTPASTPAKPAEAKPGAEFVTAFGDVGARWYLDGRTFSECAAEFIAGKDKRIKELEGELAKLAELPRGNEAATFQAAKVSNGPKLPDGVTGGAAAFAAARAARQQPQN
jgi:hypothetical protein